MVSLIWMPLYTVALPLYMWLLPENYVYVHTPLQKVSYFAHNTEVFGILYSNGTIIPQEVKQAPDAATSQALNLLRSRSIAASSRSQSPVRCYEFRNGVLIPGTMDTKGRFIPEVGGKIIPFSDYRYSPLAPRIWNLPGYFKYTHPLAKK
jgi:hypothetical protein